MGLTSSDPDAVACQSASVKAHERLGTAQDWKPPLKKVLRRLLCNSGDPPPRMVTAGSGPVGKFAANVNRGLQQHPEATVQRGWKLMIVVAENEAIDGAWRAVPHAVLHFDKDAPSGGTYVCMTADCSRDGQKASPCKFLFVPSSRMAANITDEQMLSAQFVFVSVVGGAPGYIQTVTKLLSNSVASTPEEAFARPVPKAMLPVGFLQWARMRFPYRDAVSVAEDMGLPTVGQDEDVKLARARAKTHGLWQQLHRIGESAKTEGELLKRVVALFDYEYDQALKKGIQSVATMFQQDSGRMTTDPGTGAITDKRLMDAGVTTLQELMEIDHKAHVDSLA